MPGILQWKSAREICEAEPEEPDYIVEQLLIRGAITLLSAKIKAGKSTFTGSLLRAIYAGESFIDLDTKPTRGLYCTEEGPRTFSALLKRVGLQDEDRLDVLHLADVDRAMSWPMVALEILSDAIRREASWVIIDTLPRWARVPPDKENDAGYAVAAMEPLEILRAANLAVIPIFHDRKSGGDPEDSTRGSSAYGGAADIILNLTHTRTAGHPNRRKLGIVGRFDDPTEIVIDFENGRYQSRGRDLAVERRGAKQLVEFALLKSPMSRPQLGEAIPGVSVSTLDRAIRELYEAGRITRVGSHPFVYSLSR